jgi:type I restriction enzyme R subunit
MAGFNECTRVQVPAALHLCRLGYTYFAECGEETPVGGVDNLNSIAVNRVPSSSSINSSDIGNMFVAFSEFQNLGKM